MKRRVLLGIFCAATLAAALVLCACSSQAKQSQEEREDLFENTNPPAIAVELEYNAGTGYEWQCNISDETILERRISYEQDLSENGETGSAMRAVYILKPLKEGECDVSFELVRSWDADNPSQTCSYTFKIDENNEIKVKKRSQCEGVTLTVWNESATDDQQSADGEEEEG